jgi:hypothetical protein
MEQTMYGLIHHHHHHHDDDDDDDGGGGGGFQIIMCLQRETPKATMLPTNMKLAAVLRIFLKKN